MTQTRTQQSKQTEGVQEQRIAAAIALLLAASATLPPLGGLVFLLGMLPDAPDESTRRSIAAATLVGWKPLAELDTSGALFAVQRDNLLYKAYYSISASRRVQASLSMDGGADLESALDDEAVHLRAHREASGGREAGARLNQAAAERWGPVLSWNHLNRTETHRPSHVAADGANYRPDAPPTSTEGMLPGMAPHCDCVPGPPKEGARMLI